MLSIQWIVEMSNWQGYRWTRASNLLDCILNTQGVILAKTKITFLMPFFYWPSFNCFFKFDYTWWTKYMRHIFYPIIWFMIFPVEKFKPYGNDNNYNNMFPWTTLAAVRSLSTAGGVPMVVVSSIWLSSLPTTNWLQLAVLSPILVSSIILFSSIT